MNYVLGWLSSLYPGAETEIKLRVPGERFISPCPLFVGGNKCCSIFIC